MLFEILTVVWQKNICRYLHSINGLPNLEVYPKTGIEIVLWSWECW